MHVHIQKNPFFNSCMEEFPLLQVLIPSLFAASTEKRRYSLMVVPLPVFFHFQTCPVYKTFLFIQLPCSNSFFVYLIYGELRFPGCCGYSRLSGLETGSDFDSKIRLKGTSVFWDFCFSKREALCHISKEVKTLC